MFKSRILNSVSLLAALWFVFLPIGIAEARRVALVVGISAYTYSPRLTNAANDARSISTTFKRVGFDVITSLDADLAALTAALEAFYAKADGAEAAIFYFAGHGLQLRSTNYLVPKDAQLRSEARLLQETIPLQQIVQSMEERAKITLTFLDACRDNPLAEELQRSILGKDRSAAVARGLAPMTIRNPDTLVVFAAAPGKTASDGIGGNSPFTSAMLHHMEAPGEDVELVMKRVTREVHDGTGGQQVPERLSRLTSDFALNPIRVQGWGATEIRPLPKRDATAAPMVDACALESPPIACLWSKK
jgi:uncharacterized caspase-like protein